MYKRQIEKLLAAEEAELARLRSGAPAAGERLPLPVLRSLFWLEAQMLEAYDARTGAPYQWLDEWLDSQTWTLLALDATSTYPATPSGQKASGPRVTLAKPSRSRRRRL